MCRAAAGTEPIEPLVKSGDDLRVVCQAQVIITAERQERLAVYPHFHILRTIDDLSISVQLVLFAGVERFRQIFHIRNM